MRRTCRSSTAGFFSSPFAAASSRSSSGMLLQRKNDSRDASARSDRRYAAPGATPAGSGSTRSRNFGLARMRRSAMSMPPSKRAGLLAPAREEVEQHLQVGVAQVAAVRAARKRLEDLPRARRFVGDGRGAAREDRAAAGRLAGARRAERAGHDELIDVRIAGEVDGVRRAPHVGLQAARVVAVRLLDEGDGNPARAGLERQRGRRSGYRSRRPWSSGCRSTRGRRCRRQTRPGAPAGRRR